ncbi:MAG: hypothetical protein J0L76_17435 [Rhodobacterales bacterium]|nr:hypothetical protein [Rhodobacterales bacterium]
MTPGLAMVVEAQTRNPDQFDEAKLMDWLGKTDDLNILPYARAVRCDAEVQKYEASWTYLTDNFMSLLKDKQPVG